ncbi:MAG: Oar protein [Pseudomonadota bacterium]|jgi:hypothetical protein
MVRRKLPGLGSGLLAAGLRSAAVLGAATLALPATARAQVATGKLRGTAVDAASKKKLVDAVVTVTSPALQGEQTVVTDENGEFFLPVLPPGSYLVHLEKEGYRPFNQDGIAVRLGQTIRVNFTLVPDALQAEEVVVTARPPTVDVGSTQQGVTVTPEFIQNLPVVSAGRSFESLAETAPTASSDAFGVGIGGSTSPENNFTIDGMRVTDPAYGLNASGLSVDFVKEVEVVTGGYMPEFGRSTGGVVNVLTKSGGNDYHGSVTLDLQPGLLTARAKEIQQPGSAISTDNQNVFTGNLSAELGGPIVKDKLWFFAGTQLTYSENLSTRRINTITYKQGCPVDAAGVPVSTADEADHFSLTGPDGNGLTCADDQRGAAIDAEGQALVDKITPHDTYKGQKLTQKFTNTSRSLQFMGKLTWAVDGRNTLTATGWVNPGQARGPGRGNLDGDLSYFDTTAKAFTGDYSLRWNGAFLDRRLLFEALVGQHHQTSAYDATNKAARDLPAVLWDRPHSLVEFRPELTGLCGAGDAEAAFKTCPLTNYRTGGPGYVESQIVDRTTARLTGTYLFKAAGAHELKVGGDYESMTFDLDKRYTGEVALREGLTTWTDYRRYGYLESPDKPVFLDHVRNVTGSGSFSGFAQDSWRPTDVLTVNAGIRWENQSLYGGNGLGDGQVGGEVMSFNNNWMPRVGVIVDPSREGRSKLFASYGWFYESLSLGLLDRQFPNEKQIVARRDKQTEETPAGCNPADPANAKKGGACQTEASLQANAYALPEEPNTVWTQTGGATTPVDPNLKGQRMSEATAGGEYEVVPEGRVGLTYTHRQIDRIIEDLSNDGGATYFLANPGEGLAAAFPKPQRNYDAFTAYFNRNWSRQWLVQASYTLSWLRGNYSGLFRPESGQLDPNITSDYDLKRLLANRTGYLPGDHRHNLKVFGSREVSLDERQSIILGLGVNALSGSPTNYLGADDIYGPLESFVLPRASGPRLPWAFTTDVAVKYGYKLTPASVLTVGFDLYNAFNRQVATSIDERYSDDSILPIANGTKKSLADAKTVEGDKVTVNPNFGQATSYSAPLAGRILVRLTF